MLKQQSIWAVNEMASKLTAANLSLTPVGGSPVDELSKICKDVSLENSDLQPVDVTGSFTRLIDLSKKKDVSGACTHDAAMERLVNLAADIVTSNLELARNRINPIIKTVVEDATRYADAKARGGLSPMTILTYHFPLPYNNPILAELVSRYGEMGNNDMKLGIVFPKMSAATIREKAKTGVSRLDDDVQTWLGSVTDDQIEAIYNSIFGDGSQTLNDAFADVNTRPGRALLTYLLAKRFVDDIPEGLNVNLDDYRLYVTSLMAQAGVQIVNSIRRRSDNDKMNYMVMDYPRYFGSDGIPEGVVTVNGDVYKRWITAGGTPEAIFGAIYRSAENKSYGGLLADRDEHVGNWRKAMNLLKSKADADRFGFFLEGMREALVKQIGELPEDLRCCETSTYKKRLVEHLVKVKEGGKDVPWAIARKLVCRIFFPHTEAERVLWAIADETKNNPEMDVREAALLATIGIVSDWVMDQVRIDSAGMVID
jgi:hypothetical protein